jgi:D-glycero-D-manno-heptose 1,7-bisphosphate phosphatase
LKPAVFLDRDGTIIEHVHHLTKPGQVTLLPGAPEAIRRLQSNDYACVVVTNQSVVGRGMLSDAGLQQVHDEMARLLEHFHVRLDGLYSCTLAPTVTDPTVIEHPDRKPGPGMLWRAAQELSLNVKLSWMVGDSISDILAGHNAGCRGTILLSSSARNDQANQIGSDQYQAADLLAAADLILRQDRNAVTSVDCAE